MMFCKYVKHKQGLYQCQTRVVRMVNTCGADAQHIWCGRLTRVLMTE